MKKFRDLIAEITDADKVRWFQEQIKELRLELETSKEPEIVKGKINALERELSVFVEL
jgi:hypothetical protein